ncbi:hypothetical protein R3W88_018295 [Solanum pinnatisectum]|uniref:Yippee domain-containing protein n=1 Tax=Solanum pinnatisectum TaxID=50273 RepID=A0AAV9L3Q7_9SOLN|nr:hypothetical protein R3W88_018295 [Solanum pinnatisectum]
MSIRIWFLIQQFMMRQNLPEYNHIPSVHYLYCRHCRTQVATIHADTPTLPILSRLRVVVREDERYPLVIDGMTLAGSYCVQCGNLLGGKLLRPSVHVYLWDAIISWNNVTFFDLLFGGNNERAPNDQDGGADEEQDHDQNGGANEQNVEQDKDANEQDLGANEQNDENGGINEQVPNQDVDIVEGMSNIDLNANRSLPEPTPWTWLALEDHCWLQANPWPGLLTQWKTYS